MNGLKHIVVTLLVSWCVWLQLPSFVLAECTSFCFTHDGKPFFATNYDFLDSMQEGLVFVNPRGAVKRGWTLNMNQGWKPNPKSMSTSWTAKYGSLTFNLVGYRLVWAGINEQGLTVSTMYLPGTQTPDPASRTVLDGELWLQYLLDTCADIDDVLAEGERFAVATVDHYLTIHLVT